MGHLWSRCDFYIHCYLLREDMPVACFSGLFSAYDEDARLCGRGLSQWPSATCHVHYRCSWTLHCAYHVPTRAWSLSLLPALFVGWPNLALNQIVNVCDVSHSVFLCFFHHLFGVWYDGGCDQNRCCTALFGHCVFLSFHDGFYAYLRYASWSYKACHLFLSLISLCDMASYLFQQWDENSSHVFHHHSGCHHQSVCHGDFFSLTFEQSCLQSRLYSFPFLYVVYAHVTFLHHCTDTTYSDPHLHLCQADIFIRYLEYQYIKD